MQFSQDLLQSLPLFSGIDGVELPIALKVLKAHSQKFQKGEYLLNAGDKVTELGIVLEGKAHIIKEDYEGNRHIISQITESDLFAEAFVCAALPQAPVSVLALSDMNVLFISFPFLGRDSQSFDIHEGALAQRLLANMLLITAKKNLVLSQKIDYLSSNSTKEKILLYLKQLSLVQNSQEVEVPFNRNDMAEFLGVNRSVLSRELSRLKNDGVINFDKQLFLLK